MMFSSSRKFQNKQNRVNMWKRQLFRATEFQSLMYPNFIFCRVLGTFPYKINASTFETSKIGNILQNFLFGAFCIYEVIVLRKVIVKGIVTYRDLTYTLQGVSYYTFGGFIAIITYALSGPRMRVLQAILNISSGLSSESYQKLSRWIRVKDILGTSFLIVLMSVFYFKDPEYFWHYGLLVYLDMLIFQMDMLYVNCVCVLKDCFKGINDNLVHLQNVVVNDVLRGARLICDTQNNQALLIKIKNLRKQHLTVSDTVQMLNVILNVQLLVSVVFTFTEVTFEIYNHLIQSQDGESSLFYDNSNTFFLMYVGYLVSKLILIAWACETGKKQALEIATTVHDVLNCTSDKQIKKELRLFSLQIMHCTRNTFTMKGLTVNATLLVAMAGTITTYILILAQFLIISHSCERLQATLPK